MNPYFSPTKISGILLAAGESRRMGTPKLLLPWGNTTIIEHVADTYLKSRIFELVVVIGANQDGIKHALVSRPIRVVENPHYHEGMGTSIRKGIEAASPQAAGYLIGLGDNPLITTEIINQLVTFFTQECPGIAVCTHKGETGHPVIFSRKFHQELCIIKGDRGGRMIIRQHPEEVRHVEVGSPGIFADIDTPEDYQKLAELTNFS